MCSRMERWIGVWMVVLLAATAAAVPPKVVKSVPENGAQDVDPSLRAIRVEFDQDMNRGGFSWVGGGETYPKTIGKARWMSARICVLPVKLEPNHEYWLSANNESFQNFRSKSGEPAVPYPIAFKTAGGNGGEPTEETSKATEETEFAAEGEPLEFALLDVFGREVRSEDYAGVPLAIMAGACWCGGCQQDAAPFGELAAKYAPKGIQFIRSVSGDDDLTSLEFMRHYRLPMVQLMDPTRQFEKRYNPDGWTFIMLVNRDGNVVHQENNPKMPSLAPLLDKLAEGNAPQAKTILRDGAPYMPATLERSGELQEAATTDRFPSIACAEGGRVYVAFTSNRSGNSDVFLRVFDGKAWSADQPIAASDADEFDATVIMDRNKRAWVAWTSNTGGKIYSVFAAMIEASGKSGKPMKLTEGDDDAMHTRIACDAKSRIWATYYKWHRMGSLSRDKEIYVRRLDGGKWSDEVRVSPSDVPDYEDHSEPTIVADREGVVIAWSWDYHQPKGYTTDAEQPTIFLSHVGDELKPTRAAHVSGSHIDATPAVTVDGKGRIWCAWDSLMWDGRLNGNRSAIHAGHRDLTAPKPAQAQRVSTTTTNVCGPTLASAPDGRMILVWSQQGASGRWTLMRSDLDPAQDHWMTPKTIESKGDPRFPAASFDRAGDLWLAWSAQKDNGREIAVRKLEK